MFGEWLIYASAVRAVYGAAQTVDDAVSLAFDGLDVALSSPVFRFLELRAAIALGITVDAPTERAHQDRRFSPSDQDHLPVQFGVRACGCACVHLNGFLNEPNTEKAAAPDVRVVGLGVVLCLLKL